MFLIGTAPEAFADANSDKISVTELMEKFDSRVKKPKAMPWALNLLITLASENDQNAMHLLGFIYEKGIYVKSNMQIAKQWYDKADANGFEWAL